MIRLLRPQLDHLDAAVAGDDDLAEALGVEVVPGWASFTEALGHVRDATAADPSPTAWGTRLFVAGDPGELVGWGGFKGPPDGGAVEIGYEKAGFAFAGDAEEGGERVWRWRLARVDGKADRP